MKSTLLIITTLILSFLLTPSCSKVKFYHNVTGRYNAYYNANMRVTESFAMLNKQHKDNYNKLLHMYPYAAVADAGSVKTPLDEAITKAARNILLHEISNWTDDSYLLMGKSEYLMKDYEKSAATFLYITEKYNPEALEKAEELRKQKNKKKKKKRKKRRKKKKKKKTNKSNKGSDDDEEEEKPIKYGVKHKPVHHEAMLWLAKSQIELGLFDEAGYNLRKLENDLTLPQKMIPQVAAVNAYSWIQQKELQKAIEPLQLAIDLTKKKTIKNRYVYLLGQIYQQQGNSELAMENFHQTLKLRPSYEMEFNARLNMIKNAASVSGKKPVDPELALKKMLRDSKNAEYRDQIYFALAQIYIREGKVDEGVAALQQSLNIGNNPMQRTEGSLLLGDLYYQKEDYINAYAYYDTTLMNMKKTDERYITTEDNKRKLEGVATNLVIIAKQDSMLTVGNWERRQQELWAIEGMEKDAQNPAVANNDKVPIGETKINGSRPVNRPTQSANGGTVTINDNAKQQSKFALYNNNLLKKGAKEFEKRWGERAWAENWRRANKKDEAEDTQFAATDAPPKTQSEIDDYLKKKGVPQNDKEKKAAQDELAEATFNAARHYQEDLNQSDKALALVQQLVRDYPESPYAVEGLFLGYNIYNNIQNTTKANAYRDQILEDYPNTTIAKVLKDPDFANAEQKKYQAVNKYYEDTYQLIRDGSPQQALDNVKAVPTKFGQNYEMKARFAILEAMAQGALKGETEYIRALRVVVTSFPDTKEEKQAIAMLAVLTDKKTDSTPSKNNKISPYTVDNNQNHYVLIVFDDKRARVAQYKGALSNFNTKMLPNTRMNISNIMVNDGQPTLSVRTFENAEEAIKYVVSAKSDKQFLPEVEGYKIYIISKQNYAIALSTQNFAAYIPFYEKNYK